MTRRIVILTEIISPYRIPVFNALAQLEGLVVHVIFLAETDAARWQWRVYKDEIHFSYQVLPSWRWEIGKTNVLWNRGLWPALNRANPEVIICGGYNYFASWEALLWARRHHAKFVLWSESNRHDARGGWACVEWLKACFLERCDGFVVPGQASLEYLQSLGVARDSIVVAPNAVANCWFQAQANNIRTREAEFRERLRLPRRFVLFVGRLVREKGVFDLLEAYAKLDAEVRSKVGLVFAGDGIARAELERRAEGISPGTTCFCGFAHREDLAGLYACTEALVLPTHSDPWGLVVNEAMACGLPIIVSSVAGCARDLVEDGRNGYVVPPRDPERLRAAINSLVRNPEVGRQMSARSSERIKDNSPEACATGLAAAAARGQVQ